MLALQVYARRSSASRALLVLFVTLLPCVLTVILLDLIPLEAPERGLAHNHTFWLRSLILVWICNFALLEQGRHYITSMPSIARSQLAAVSLFGAADSVAISCSWARLIGYPLPFFPCINAPWCVLLTTGIATVLWGKHIRGKPAAQADLFNFVKTVGTPILLIFVYPAYNYVFVGLTSPQQTTFTLLLPVIKILAKNVVAYMARHIEDFKPEVVIFNVEIFHALSVANCTQQFNALHTTIVLMSVDFLQACASLHDVDLQLRVLRELMYPVVPSITGQQASLSLQAHCQLNAMDAATYIVSIDRQVRSSASLRLVSNVLRLGPKTVAVRLQESVQDNPEREAASRVDKNHKLRGKEKRWCALKGSARATVRPGGAPTPSVEGILDALANTTRMSDADKQRLQALSPEARLQVIQQTLQLLHLTEFLLLVEFTEVIVPCIYCIFLGVVSQLPNRQFYTNVRDFDHASLKSNIGKIMAYASLEVLSFVMLASFLTRKLRMSPLQQLAFVLETQWQLVQSKLVLWVLYSLQMTLVHMGLDYSFQFA